MKPRFVTRSCSGTIAHVMCVDVEKSEVVTKDFRIGETFKDDEKLLKALRKVYQTDKLQLVKVKSTEPFKGLFGVYEWEFFAMMRPMDPTRHTFTDDPGNEPGVTD